MTSSTFSGKVAIITGSTSGIGAGIAKALAQNGANIILNGFGDDQAIEKQRAELQEISGGTCLYSDADLSCEAGVQSLISCAVDDLGRIDILVNNAGIQHTSPIEDFPAEKWQLIMDLMLSAPFHAIKASLSHMRAQGWGRIVNISSVHGLVASVNKSAYVAAKHGLIGLSKVTALETANDPITSNCICPGWVLTPLVQQQIDKIAQDEGISNDAARVKLLSEKQPCHQFTTVEQLGELVCFLCSEAASNMTGSSYSIDGGWSTQ